MARAYFALNFLNPQEAKVSFFGCGHHGQPTIPIKEFHEKHEFWQYALYLIWWHVSLLYTASGRQGARDQMDVLIRNIYQPQITPSQARANSVAVFSEEIEVDKLQTGPYVDFAISHLNPKI